MANVRRKTHDIFLTSSTSTTIWISTSGRSPWEQHVLDRNFGFEQLGNVRDRPIHEIVTEKNSVLDRMLAEVLRNLASHRKCSGCRYRIASAPRMRSAFPAEWQQDDGELVLPDIFRSSREFQRDKAFLTNMIDGFKELGF